MALAACFTESSAFPSLTPPYCPLLLPREPPYRPLLRIALLGADSPAVYARGKHQRCQQDVAMVRVDFEQ